MAKQELLSSLFNVVLKQTRGKRSIGGGVTRNRFRHRIEKQRNIYVNDGEHVIPGQVLVRQRNLVFYPGQNVSLSDDYTLKSIFSGSVYITFEKLSPHPNSPLYEYANFTDVYKKFVSVIPDPRHDRFKLINTL